MKRTVSETRVGEGKIRYRTRVEDDEVAADQMIAAQRLFLNHLASNQELLTCGYSRFQRLSLFWDGARWVAEAEATLDEVLSNG